MKPNVIIDPSLFDIYPEIRLGCIYFRSEVREPDDKFWKYMDENICTKWFEYLKDHELPEIEGIRGSREAYKAFGRSPSKYRVSSEALLRRIRQGNELYHVNSVVDVNNLISVESGLSVGSYDLANIRGDIILRVGKEGEGYEGIGKKFLAMDNMLVLADDEGLFGSSMSDSHRAMITESADEVLAVIYCFSDAIDLYKLLDDSAEAFKQYADAYDIETWMTVNTRK